METAVHLRRSIKIALPQPAIAGVGVALLSVVAGIVLLGLVPLAAAGLIDARSSFEWFIAVRYLFARRRQTMISIITGICVVGIAAGGIFHFLVSDPTRT